MTKKLTDLPESHTKKRAYFDNVHQGISLVRQGIPCTTQGPYGVINIEKVNGYYRIEKTVYLKVVLELKAKKLSHIKRWLQKQYPFLHKCRPRL